VCVCMCVRMRVWHYSLSPHTGKQKEFCGPYRDVGGGSRDPKKQKEFCSTIQKSQKPNISLKVDVGVCYEVGMISRLLKHIGLFCRMSLLNVATPYSVTGTRFPQNISFSAIRSVCGNGTLIGTTHEVRSSRVINGYRQPGYLPLPSTSPSMVQFNFRKRATNS